MKFILSTAGLLAFATGTMAARFFNESFVCTGDSTAAELCYDKIYEFSYINKTKIYPKFTTLPSNLSVKTYSIYTYKTCKGFTNAILGINECKICQLDQSVDRTKPRYCVQEESYS